MCSSFLDIGTTAAPFSMAHARHWLWPRLRLERNIRVILTWAAESPAGLARGSYELWCVLSGCAGRSSMVILV